MHALRSRFGALIFVVLIACAQEVPAPLVAPDASLDRDASQSDAEISEDAGLVDTGVHTVPRCEPGMEFVELPMPRVSQTGGVFAQPNGVIYERGEPPSLFSWNWEDRTVTPLAAGRLVAADRGQTLYDSGRRIVLLGGTETSTFSGQSLGFAAKRGTLGQPYGGEFFQSQFVAWPVERAFRLAVNIFDYDETRREIGLVDIGPAVSSNHVSWIATSTASSDEWVWVVEDQETRQRYETRIAKYTDVGVRLKVTDNEAYVFQQRGDDTVLHVWQFTEAAPIELPTELRDNCRFLAGSQALLVCDAFAGSVYSLTPSRVNIIRTGTGFIRGASQSDGRVLFLEVDGAQARVVVVNLSTGERTDLTPEFMPPNASVRTSFVDDVAVWSFDGNATWGAALLCP